MIRSDNTVQFFMPLVSIIGSHIVFVCVCNKFLVDGTFWRVMVFYKHILLYMYILGKVVEREEESQGQGHVKRKGQGHVKRKCQGHLQLKRKNQGRDHCPYLS